MTTDSFDNVTINSNIGQSTYVEIISIKEITHQAFKQLPSTDLAYNILAFQKPSNAIAPRDTPTFVPAPRSKYSINKNIADQKSSQNKSEKINRDFHDILTLPKSTRTTTGGCAEGFTNLISDPSFDSGVSGLIDQNDVPLTSEYWDSTNKALVITPTNNRHTIKRLFTGLIPGKVYTITFNIVSTVPITGTNHRGILYYVTDSSGTQLNNYLRYANRGGSEGKWGASFIAPDNGQAIFIIDGDGSNQLYKLILPQASLTIDFIDCCVMGTIDGFRRIDYTNFANGPNGWVVPRIENKVAKLYENVNSFISKSFNDIEINKPLKIQIHIADNGISNVIYPPGPFGAGPAPTVGLATRLWYRMGVVITDIGNTPNTTTIELSNGPGSYTLDYIPKSQNINIRIVNAKMLGYVDMGTYLGEAHIAEIALHAGQIKPCDKNINSNVRIRIELLGRPTYPINLFNAFIRYKYRDVNNSFNYTYINKSIDLEGHTGIQGCNTWKQQGNGGQLDDDVLSQQLTLSLSSQTPSNGEFRSIINKNNWLWPIPTIGSQPNRDQVILTFHAPPDGLIESVEFLFLANTININNPEDLSFTGPFVCDEANALQISLEYTNRNNVQQSFSANVNLTDLYETTANYNPSDEYWDVISNVGNGIKATTARWESVEFILDAIEGDGLDQCTEPIQYDGDLNGQFVFSKFEMQGYASVSQPLEPSTCVVELVDGQAINEVQSIIIPPSYAGKYNILFDYNDIIDTVDIPWNATSNLLRTRLASLDNILGTNNIMTSGNGTNISPFLVTFMNDLGARDVPLLEVDTTGLAGSASASTQRLRSGTTNERQMITNVTDTLADLIISSGSNQTAPIDHDATLNEFQSALEALLGVGNVIVTGRTTDRDIAYKGPWFIDFRGVYAGANVQTLTVEPSPQYKVTVEWQGDIGANELQQVIVDATGGSFTLELYPPSGSDDGNSYITNPISWNATAATVKQSIIQSANFLTSNDITVTKISHETLNIWNVEFRGAYANIEIPLISADGGSLVGQEAIVAEVVKGGGVSERQRVIILNGSGGTFRLRFNINNTIYTTVPIPVTATIDQIEVAILNLAPFDDGDVTVINSSGSIPAECGNGNVLLDITLIFDPKFGNIPPITIIYDSDGSLTLTPVAEPPYPYEPPICDDAELISFQTGPLFCRPEVDGSIDEPYIACCDGDNIRSSANVVKQLSVQRDLFDPSENLSIRKMALQKGLNPNDYIPYLRNFESNTLEEVDYSHIPVTKSSIILLSSDLNTVGGKNRAINYLKTNTEILPARFVWPKNGF